MSEVKQKLIEATIHSIVITIISLAVSYLVITNVSNMLFMSVSAVIGIVFLINYIRKPYNKDYLIVNSWICLIGVLFIGNFIGKNIPPASLFGVGVGMSVFDIISFTRFGTKTTNAKVMDNKKLMYKLIVYGKSLKDGKPLPTTGLGDFLFYFILLSGIYKVSSSYSFLFMGACLILLGCVINFVIIYFIYGKKWYKGFPATFIPFILILPLLLKIMN
ncbi:hypothetical protein ACJDT4_03105 [Clostridium neuense]|uniref:Uncharacterized protein n=1 Tax=Clostridium neuense TaxID=1728934 RepID=A0ABW8TA31_9CLOT